MRSVSQDLNGKYQHRLNVCDVMYFARREICAVFHVKMERAGHTSKSKGYSRKRFAAFLGIFVSEEKLNLKKGTMRR